ncbi:MAG: hypothetical protein ABR517_05340, partial [Thermoanaerobaculia bacterium]
MRAAVGLLLVMMLAACGGAPAPQPMPVETSSAPAPDPRISEMQILLNELLDRLEVMNARVQ